LFSFKLNNKYVILLSFGLLLILYVAGQNKIDSLKTLLSSNPDQKSKSQLLLELAAEIKGQDLNSAMQYAFEAKDIATQNGFLREEGVARSVLGLLYSYTDLIDSAIYWNTSAIPLLANTNDSLEISRNYNRLGTNFLLKKEYPDASKYLLEALKWSSNPKVKAMAFNNLGMISKKTGDYADAVEFYLGALQQYENLNEPRSKARTLGNLGSLYIQKKDYEKAKQMYNSELEICKAISEKELSGQAISGLGIVETHLGSKGKAIAYFTEAAAIFKELNIKSDYAQQIVSIAGLQSESKLYKLAEKNYREAELVLLEINDKGNLGLLYNNLADCYLAQKKYKSAVAYLEKAYAYSKEFKDINYTRLIAKNLSDTYENLGEVKKALQFRKLYESLNDEMVNVAENVKYAELNHAYETTKKEEKIQEQDRQIVQIESSKNTFFILSGILAFVATIIFILLRKRVNKSRVLEENISSISKQISSLKDENSDLKNKLVQTEIELRNLEAKYSEAKETLPDNLIQLSKREYEVLLFIAEGLSDKEIAEKIFVSINTVRTHIRRIYDKLLVNNRMEAVGMLNKFQLLSEAS
jgi:DNA-binding CsgD family transcriptional regulator/uncharacterized protein HemY